MTLNKASYQLPNWLLNTLAHIVTTLLGVVFAYSGFVKMVDPYGTAYKIQDYLTSFAAPHIGSGAIILSYLLYTFEFVLGVNLLIRSRMRITATIALLFMSMMTLLTLYLAIANPVKDCGCFGDALILTNWETFFKNVILTFFAFLSLYWNHRLREFLTRRLHWIPTLWSIIFSVMITWHALVHLPLFDFRPYHIGAHIAQQMAVPAGEKPDQYTTTFILQKEGKEQEFTLDQYPSDTTWQFVRQHNVLTQKGYTPPIHDFVIYNLSTQSDITDQILEDTSYVFLLVTPSLSKTAQSNTDKINDIYDYAAFYGYPFYMLTASDESAIQQWIDETGAEYQFCNVDQIALKTMIRAYPGLVVLKNGTIIQKFSHQDIPSEEQLSDSFSQLPIGKQAPDNSLRKITIIGLIWLLPILLALLLDKLFPQQSAKLKIRYDKITHVVEHVDHILTDELEKIADKIDKEEPTDDQDTKRSL